MEERGAFWKNKWWIASSVMCGVGVGGMLYSAGELIAFVGSGVCLIVFIYLVDGWDLVNR